MSKKNTTTITPPPDTRRPIPDWLRGTREFDDNVPHIDTKFGNHPEIVIDRFTTKLKNPTYRIAYLIAAQNEVAAQLKMIESTLAAVRDGTFNLNTFFAPSQAPKTDNIVVLIKKPETVEQLKIRVAKYMAQFLEDGKVEDLVNSIQQQDKQVYRTYVVCEISDVVYFNGATIIKFSNKNKPAESVLVAPGVEEVKKGFALITHVKVGNDWIVGSIQYNSNLNKDTINTYVNKTSVAFTNAFVNKA
jgi:hypothetical protein